MTSTGTTCGEREGEIFTVAAAMLRYGLPSIGPDGARLEISRDSEGTWLRLIFPPSDIPLSPPSDIPHGGHGDPGELIVIDSIADRWGSHGGTDRPSTLWALLR